MTFRTPWTVQQLPYVGSTPDAHGNDVKTWGAPIDRPVYGWASPQPQDVSTVGVDAILVTLQVFAPTFAVDPLDRFMVPGYPDPFEAVGDPGDYDHGPFGFTPGMVINLKRGE